MSRAYRIRISESLERVVHVEDGVATTLELLPLLPRPRMTELLAREHTASGLELTDGVARRTRSTPNAELALEIDLSTLVVTLRAESSVDLQLKIDKEHRVAEEHAVKRAPILRKEARDRLEQQAELASEETRRAATASLEGELRDVRSELDRVVHRVTAAALKERAMQLGEIQEMVEDVDAGTLTIRLKV